MRASVHDTRQPVKYRLRGGTDPVRLLHREGYQAHPPVEHEDTWFERPQGAMLGSLVLRHDLARDSWTMAWETTIRSGGDAEKHHLWTKVDGPAMWKRLERLGMQPVLQLRGTRIALSKGPLRVALERIRRMGDFLEVPGPGRDGRLRHEFHELLRHLGAGPEPRSYRDLAAA
jgi:adenylate cyclase class IV